VSRPIVVVYDVTDDERRALVRNVLRPVALRLQQSTWMIAPQPGLTAAGALSGLSLLLTGDDRLQAVQPCAGCRRHLRSAASEPDPQAWLASQVV